MTPTTLREGSARAASPEQEIARCVTPPFVVYVLAAPLVGAGLSSLLRAAVAGCVDVTPVGSVSSLMEGRNASARHRGSEPKAVVLAASVRGLELLTDLWRQQSLFGSGMVGKNNLPSHLMATALALDCRQPDLCAHITAARARGVRVFLSTDDTTDILIRAVTDAATGQEYISPPLRSSAGRKSNHNGVDAMASTKMGAWLDLLESRSPRWAALSERQREVASLAAAGLSNEEIGELLFIDITTVKTHLRDSYRKMGICRRSQLALHLTL